MVRASLGFLAGSLAAWAAAVAAPLASDGLTATEIVAAVNGRYETLDRASTVQVETIDSPNTGYGYRSGWLDLAVSGDKVSVISEKNRRGTLWIVGEEFVWRHDPKQHLDERFERDAAEGAKIREFVDRQRERLITHYVRVNDLHSGLSLLGEEELRIDKVVHLCVRVRIAPNTGAYTEDIWVEHGTNLVWKSVRKWPWQGNRVGFSQVTVWHRIQAGEPDAGTFVFGANNRSH